MRAEIYRNQDDASPAATGHAFENRSEGYVNKTSYIENCETSAVGRALALLGYEIKRGIASREEMEKADRMSDQPAKELDGGVSKMRPSVQAINPTVERNVLLKGVMDARKLLGNAEGAASGGDFTPAHLVGLINQMFSVDGLDELSNEQLKVLLKELSAKLDAVKARVNEPKEMPTVSSCECGIARVRREGTKNGKKWAAWMCANKVKEHAPIWIDLKAEAEAARAEEEVGHWS